MVFQDHLKIGFHLVLKLILKRVSSGSEFNFKIGFHSVPKLIHSDLQHCRFKELHRLDSCVTLTV